MVSDKDIGKKMIEREALGAFLEAREEVTGERFSEILGLSTESPDFICVRPLRGQSPFRGPGIPLKGF